MRNQTRRDLEGVGNVAATGVVWVVYFFWGLCLLGLLAIVASGVWLAVSK